jgi:hypothetical protein
LILRGGNVWFDILAPLVKKRSISMTFTIFTT